jgi:hypothetical protein
METEETKSPLDRALQRDLLLKMQVVYPGRFTQIPAEETDPAWEPMKANLLYLEEHGLCQSGFSENQNGTFEMIRLPRITAQGLDFLREDGGLSAILGTVTVKLDGGTIRNLILAKIDASTLPVEEKSSLRKHATALSGAALRAGTQDLIRIGLEHLPDGIQWLHTLGGF